MLRFLGAFLAFFAVLVLAMGSWIEPAGMLSDVYLHGAEPKGSFAAIVRNLKAYGLVFFYETVEIGPIALVLAWWAARAPAAEEDDRRWAWHLIAAGVAVAAGVLRCEVTGEDLRLQGPAAALWFALPRAYQPLWVGLLVTLIGTARAMAGRASPTALAVLVVILVPAAVSHNLSTVHLRWAYDNNPLVVVVIAAALLEMFAAASLLPVDARLPARALIVCAVSLVGWRHLAPQLAVARRCTVRWPEVTHLHGARMRPRANALREVVQLVRDRVEPDETVLVLPEDPNLVAWFERPRPRTQGAVLFADLYWDRFVDEDFDRIAADPPRMIVVGPRRFGPKFQKLFHPELWGATRLQARIEGELLPVKYVKLRTLEVAFQEGKDEVDVFVRK